MILRCDTVRCVARRIEALIARRKGLPLKRFDDRRIVEGHGDLRPKHIRARIAILCTSKSSRSATR